MTSDPKMPNLTEDALFDLLEHPEQWPEDPALQAQLAELLELHLAMRAHADDLDQALLGDSRRVWWRQNVLGAAAAVLLVVLPTVYVVQHSRYLSQQRQNEERIQTVALRRGQDRLMAGFLRQSSELLRDFERNPPVCGLDRSHEDRSAERQLAMALKTRSQMLLGQGGQPQEAQALLNNLHDWLLELSLEDGCMSPERVQQLRKLAKAHNLPDEVERLSRAIEGGTP